MARFHVLLQHVRVVTVNLCHFQKLTARISEVVFKADTEDLFSIGTELPCRSDVSVEGLAGHAKFCAQLANVSGGLTIEACARRT